MTISRQAGDWYLSFFVDTSATLSVNLPDSEPTLAADYVTDVADGLTVNESVSPTLSRLG